MAKSPNKVVMVKKDRNVVAEYACWEEAIKKETKSQVLNEHFQINPKSLVILTDKPMVRKAEKKDYAEELGEQIHGKLMSISAEPKKKYPFPMTSNQEVGWDWDEIKFKPMATHTKRSCEETKYANSYYTMTRSSPFVDKKI